MLSATLSVTTPDVEQPASDPAMHHVLFQQVIRRRIGVRLVDAQQAPCSQDGKKEGKCCGEVARQRDSICYGTLQGAVQNPHGSAERDGE